MPKRNERTEEKRLKLGSHPFFKSLTGPGSTYEGEPLDKIIRVVAVEGDYDMWAVYYETPDCHGDVAGLGNKLTEEVATALFPEWAKRLNWRR